jgi:rhodanese-related sulfurtransferase
MLDLVILHASTRRNEKNMSIAAISINEFAKLYQTDRQVQLIDVRTPAEYREVHVAFARNVPLEQLSPAALIEARNAAHGGPLYVVCQLGGRGRQACQKLLQAGFTGAINVEGGTEACVAAGLPVVRGEKTISLERQVRIAAGSLVLLGALLAWLVSPWFTGLAAFAGAGLVFAGIMDTCGMGILLAHMPWNQRRPDTSPR